MMPEFKRRISFVLLALLGLSMLCGLQPGMAVQAAYPGERAGQPTPATSENTETKGAVQIKLLADSEVPAHVKKAAALNRAKTKKGQENANLTSSTAFSGLLGAVTPYYWRNEAYTFDVICGGQSKWYQVSAGNGGYRTVLTPTRDVDLYMYDLAWNYIGGSALWGNSTEVLNINHYVNASTSYYIEAYGYTWACGYSYQLWWQRWA